MWGYCSKTIFKYARTSIEKLVSTYTCASPRFYSIPPGVGIHMSTTLHSPLHIFPTVNSSGPPAPRETFDKCSILRVNGRQRLALAAVWLSRLHGHRQPKVRTTTAGFKGMMSVDPKAASVVTVKQRKSKNKRVCWGRERTPVRDTHTWWLRDGFFWPANSQFLPTMQPSVTAQIVY